MRRIIDHRRTLQAMQDWSSVSAQVITYRGCVILLFSNTHQDPDAQQFLECMSKLSSIYHIQNVTDEIHTSVGYLQDVALPPSGPEGLDDLGGAESPSASSIRRRVKVYELRSNDWYERGIGFCKGRHQNVSLHVVHYFGIPRDGARGSQRIPEDANMRLRRGSPGSMSNRKINQARCC